MHPSLNPSLVLRRLEGAGGNRNIIIAVCLLIAIPLAYVTTNNRELHEWRELYAFSGQLDDILVNKTSTNIYKSCPGNSFKLPGSDAIIGPEELKTLVAASAGEEGTGPADDDAPQEFQEVEVQYAPCKGHKDTACCKHTVYMRVGTTDFNVYSQIFMEHQLSYLYTLFEHRPPKYILDAGANAGFASSMFKLMWPDATVVSVEPNPKNFEALKRNTAKFKKVHPVNAGLWGHKAKIGQVGSHGEWGLVFRELPKGSKEEGLQAYGVKDLGRKFGISGFDFVKIDIEGAEGMVLAPEEDVSWIDKAMVVSLEVHDFFAGYFALGAKDISSRVEQAFRYRKYAKASDNEHVMYVNYKLLKTIM